MPEANKKQYYVQFEGAKQGVVVDADKYEANKERLYKEHPNATVIETYDYDGDDKSLNPDSSSFIVQFEGASQAVNVPYDDFMKKKEQLFKEHPNARISVSRTESDDYWGQKASQSMADMNAFNADENRGGFMREYEKQAEQLKQQAISGSVARNADSANPLADFITQNSKQYEQLKNEKKVLEDSFFNNPKVQQQMQSSKDYADKQRGIYMEKVDSSYGAEKRDYRRAAQIQKDIADLYSAVTRYGEEDKNGFREYFKGMGDTFNDVDFWTMGITDTARRFDVSGIQRKLQKAAQEGKLTDAKQIDELITPSEKELLVSFYQLNAAQANTAQGISHGYNAGKSAAESLGFMAQFMVSGGIGKVAGSALMKSTNVMAQWLGRAIAGNGAMAKGVENELAKIALTDLAEPIAQAVFHTITQPAATLNSISQQMTNINDEGQMLSVGTAIKRGIADTLIENWSESIGTASEETAKLLNLSEKLGKSSLSKTDLYRWARWLNNTKADELIRQAGFNGLISEMGEEWIGNAARVGIGLMDKQEFRQWGGDLLAGKKAYPDKDERKAARKEAIANQLEMAASFALMTGINTAVSGYGAIKQAKLYNDAVDKEKEILARAGASDEEIQEIFNTKYDTSADIAKKFAPWAMKIYENSSSDEQAVEDYAQTLRFVQTANSQVIAEEVARLQKEQDRSNADAELLNMTGNTGYTHVVPGAENETVRTITDENGRRAFLQEESNGAYAVRYDDGGVGFLTDEAIKSGIENSGWIDSGEMSRDDFLDNYVAEKKAAAEKTRMEQEYAQKADAVRMAAPPQSVMNIGTAEAPVNGIVVQWTPDGCVVQSTEDNSTQLYSVEQIAEKLGMSISVKTDAELDEERADEEIANEELRRKQNQHSGLVFDFNGNKYILDRVYDIKNGEEDGGKTATVSASQMMENGTPDLPEDIELPVQVILDAISSNAPELSESEQVQAAVQNFKENNEAQAEADALAEEDNIPRDFRGNALPLTPEGDVDQKTLWNKDPEAWTVWNDNNPDRIVDSRVYAQGRMDFIDGELKRLDKAIVKETKTTGDFDKIREYNGQIRDLTKRKAVIASIMDNYAKMDAAAKEAEQAQAAAQKEAERMRTAELNEPQNITQLATRMLQEVKAHSISRESLKNELGWGNKELSQFFPWLAKKGKGLSIDALAEQMVERDGQYGYVPMVGDAEQKDTQAAKDALIEVLQSISRPGEVRDMVLNENKAYEDALRDAEEAAIEAELMEKYGITKDEYDDMSEEEKAGLDEMKNSALDNTTDTGETLSSEQNDTATLQNTVSGSKDAEIPENTNIPEENSAEDVELNGQLYNISDLERQFQTDIEMLLVDNGIDAEVVGVKLIGSRIAGSPRVDSDLDLLVEYKGDYSEDALFNMLNSEEWEINGVKLDINPITEGKSGTIEQFLKRNAGFVKNESEPEVEEEATVKEGDEIEDEGPVAPVRASGAEYEISPNAASEEEIDATEVTEDEVNAIRFGGWDTLRSERTGETIKTYGGTTLFSPGHESGVHVTMTSANGGRREGDSTAEYLAKYLKANGFVSIETEPAATKNKYGYWINKYGVITGAEVIILESSKKGYANSSAASIARLDNGKWVAEAGKKANNFSEQFDSKVDAIASVLRELKKHYEAHKDEKGNEMFGPREKKDELNLINHLEKNILPAELLKDKTSTHKFEFKQEDDNSITVQGSLFGEEESEPEQKKAKKQRKQRQSKGVVETDENFDEDAVNTTDVPVEVIVVPGNEDSPQACRIHLFEKDGKWNSLAEVWADNGNMSKAGTNSGSYPYGSREEAIQKAVSYFEWYRENKAKEAGTEGIDVFLDYVTLLPKQVERANEIEEIRAESSKNDAQDASEQESKGQYGANNKLVTNERYEELKKRMIAKLNNLNAGFDPETLAIGCEMAAYHIEAGARLFVDYAQRMIADLGDAIKPYLKSMYNGARDLPGMEDYAAEMDDYQTVSETDVKNIGLADSTEFNEGDLVIHKGRSMKVVGVHPKTLDLEYNPTGFLPVTSMGVPITDVTKFISFHQEDISELLENARQEVNTEPTSAQKEAGNYKMGHVKIDGYDFTMENPKGSVRKGVDGNGTPWEITMNNDYGYIRGTKGVDGDHIDMFLSDNPEQGDVYVVDQVKPDGSFDEHKVMYGFNSVDEAKAAYLSNYSEGWQGLGSITPVSKDEFKKWIDSSHRKTKPFAEYASVKPLQDEAPSMDVKNVSESRLTEILDYVEKGLGGWNQQQFYSVESAEGEYVAENLAYKDNGGIKISVVYDKENDGWAGKRIKVEVNISGNYEILKNSQVLSFNASNDDILNVIKGFYGLPHGTLSDNALMKASFEPTPLGTITKDKHTKTGEDLWVVKPTERVSSEDFKQLKASAKQNGGYWSSFKHGFIFTDEESANKFNNSNTKEYAETTDEQTAANTDAIVSKAGSIAEEASALAESKDASGREVSEATEQIDNVLSVIDDQLAILGYYAADMDSKFDESFGYSKSAQKKAQKDVNKLAKSIAADLGIDVGRGMLAKANIAPAGGDVYFYLPLMEGRELYLTVYVEPKGYDSGYGYSDDIVARGTLGSELAIMWRVENPSGRGHERYGDNHHERANVPYHELLRNIRNAAKDYLPVQTDSENIIEVAKKVSSANKTKKEKSLPLNGDELLGGLFDTLSEKDAPAVEEQVSVQESVKAQRPTEVNGFKVGDRVRYSYPGREPAEVTIVDFEDGRPVLDSFGASWITELADWEYISRIEEPQNTVSNGDIISTGSTGEDRAVGEGDGQADEQPVTSGVDRGSQLDSAADGSRSGRVAESDARRELEPARSNTVASRKPQKPAVKKNTRNNRAKRGESFAPTTSIARFNANIAAIKKMRELVETEKEASKDDMAVLRQYTGWGGLGTFFNDKYSSQYRQLNELLSAEEMQDAEMSINSAYYTPVSIIDQMWDLAKRLGFNGGKVLEGSAGIGNILQQMPKDMSEASDITAVEIDSITGNILKLLYPDADVQIKGFQDTRIANNSVDLAITNVPFVTGLSVFDEVEQDLSRKFTDIHDFCIAKNVRKLKEGGIGIFITSKGTLDKSKKLRQWVVNEGGSDFIGAFRLNNETFGGTSVTSDIIVIRKRVAGAVSPNAIDVSGTSVTRRDTYHEQGDYNYRKREWDSKDIPVAMEYNSYFVEHPENMAGEMLFGFDKNDTHRPTSTGLYPKDGMVQDKALAKWVRSMRNDAEPARAESAAEIETESTSVKEGQLVINSKGEICISRQGMAVPVADNGNKVKGHSKATVLKDYNAIKDALKDALDYQLKNESDEGLKPLLAALNRAYDTFVRKYGQLNRNVAISFLRDDVDFASTAAIENYSEKEGTNGKKQVEVSKTDIFNKRMIGHRTTPTPQSTKDGVLVSMNQFGRIDAAYIAGALGRSEEEVRKEIVDSGLGFIDPMNGALEVNYRYLSGNVREKLAYARMHNDAKEYDRNIEALEKVIPADIPAHIIEFSLGSDWIEKNIYIDYAKERFGVGEGFNISCLGGVWQLVGNTDYFEGASGEKNRSAGVTGQVVQKTVYGHQLMIAAMNNASVTFQKQETDPVTGSKVTITDKNATQAASQKMEEMKEDFRQWCKDKMMQDTELAERTGAVYNNLFNNYAPMEIDDMFLPERFDGSVLTMGDKPFSLYKHQKRAAIRGTMEPVMLAHEVGAGKTFTLISTAMEMRRLGTANKPMIVVQNATVGQFVTSAKTLYPNAKILTVSERDHTAEGRATFYAKIKYNDWDLIIVPQSVFDEIPDSEERKHQFIQDKIDEKMYVLSQAKEAKADQNAIRQMERELEDLQFELATGETKQTSKKRDAKKEALAKENAASRAKKQLARKVDDVSDFDDMGIDALLVDEAHNYKKLGFSTSIKRGVKGVDTGYSLRAAGLYLKTRSVFDKRGWKNVVFATGTPISNTAAEIWTFMKYLMPADVMKQNHIFYFDDFVRNFGSIAQSLEFTTNGKFRENTRFGAYVNVPELVRIWASVCDTVLTRDAEAASGKKLEDKLPKLEGGKAQDVFLPQSPSLIGIMKQIRKELDRFEKMSGKEKKENSHIPLTCYGRAKKAAIDPRLVSSNAKDEPLSKTNKAVETILQDYKDTQSYKGTSAVFCDNFQRLNPETKAVEFNLFDEIKSKLIANGIPENEIVIMKSGLSEKKKEQIFAAVNAGDIRVILGSTQTLGTGVNIQERLHMVIHMDAPDRPMDYTQRNGRILRQGNKHLDWDRTVKIIRFGVEDSLDVTSYQRLKTKSGFIDSVMNGKQYLENSMENRVLEEEEEGLFDNPVAVLSGSEFALLKSQAERELRKYQSKYQQHKQDQIYIDKQTKENAKRISNFKELSDKYKGILSRVRETFKNGNVGVVNIEGYPCRNGEEIGAILRERINPEIKRFQQSALSNFWQYHGFTEKDIKSYQFVFDGIPVKVRVAMRTDYDSKSQQIVKTRYYLSIPELGIETEREMTSIRGAINYVKEQVATGKLYETSLELYRSTTAKLNSDNAEMEKRRGKGFAEMDKLKEAQQRVDEFTEKMRVEMEEKEARYAAMDSEDVTIDDSDDFDDSDTHNREIDSDVDDNAVKLLDTSNPLVVAEAMTAVRRLQERIGVPVRFVRGSDAKGHYTEGKNEVVINIGAHESIDDVVETYLHEAVAHFGLRQLMGDEFDSFIDTVWNNATESIRNKIRASMSERGWKQAYATEEYIAELAQKTDYTKSERSLWRKIVDAVRNFINSISGRENRITDDTIREILVASYQNLENNNGKGKSAEEAKSLLSRMQDNAEVIVPRELTADVWKNEIEGKTFDTPVGKIKFGENQYDKNKGKGREREFGMLLPTVQRPDIIFEESAPEEGAERQTKYVFVKTFVDENGAKHINYASVSISKGGMEVVESSHYLRDKQVLNKIEKEQMLWNRLETDSTSSAQGSSNDQNNALSTSKDTDNNENNNNSAEKTYLRTAYHGSAADFDKFDLSYVGEGEGAQAHGYGTYVAFDENTGIAYANKLAGNAVVWDGLDSYTSSHQVAESVVNSDYNGNIKLAKKSLALAWPAYMRPEYVKIILNSELDDWKINKNQRNVYTVEIPENDGTNYIDEMKTLPKAGRRRIADVVRALPDSMLMRDTHGPNWLPNGLQTLANAIENNQYAGLELRERLVDAFGYEQFASEIFSNAGFVGMLYDGKRDGECAVIFNTDDLFILEHTHFRLREKPAPKKTGIGYKVFFQKNGKLYPPMVANPNGEDTPVGVWLDADAAPIAGASKTGRPQVKAGGKGTQGGSGQLAYRPGWHLGKIPYAIQFNRKDENGDKTLFPKDFVWAEVEYAADKDYQKEAEAEGINASGKYQHSLAGLKRLPEDGFYMYRTNPNPETDPWIITGAMKVNKVLTRDEVDELVRAAGREPQRVEGDSRNTESFDTELRQIDNELEGMSRFDERYNGFQRQRRDVFARYIDTIKSKDFNVAVTTVADFEKDALTIGANQDEASRYELLSHMGIGGVELSNGTALLVADNVPTIEDARQAYVHERQHKMTEDAGPEFIEKVIRSFDGIGGREYTRVYLKDAVRSIGNTDFYDNYDETGLAKEFVSFAMQLAYTDENFAEEMKKRYIRPAAIDIIKELDNEQRKDNDLASARRWKDNALYDGGRNRNDEQNPQGGAEYRRYRTDIQNEGTGRISGNANEGGSREVNGEEPSISRDRFRTGSFGVTASLPAREQSARDTATKLGVDVEVVSRDKMPSGHEFSQGVWADGKIFICPENCADADDVAMTVVHEAVGHNGLRRLVGNERMSNFCMELFNNSTGDIRRDIIEFSSRHGYNFVEGVEEYLAYLSETMDFTEPQRTFWEKVKDAVRSLLASIGINLPVDGRDLRWILWQSYNANKRGELEVDIMRAVMAHRLGFSLKAEKDRGKARRIVRDRVVEDEYADSAAAMYNRAAADWRTRLRESWVEQYASVEELVKVIEKSSGKPVKAFEDVRKALNQQSSKGLNAIERWENDFFKPLVRAIKTCMDAAGCSVEDVERYVMLKHGLERNEKFAKRDAREYYQSIFDAYKNRLENDDKLDTDEREKLIKKAEDKLKKHLDNVENGTDKKYLELREKDYGGLTALYTTYSDNAPFVPEVETEEQYNERRNNGRRSMYETLAETELAATEEVQSWESRFGDNHVELWARINAATKDTLKHQYESNMISKSQYEHVRDMFEYYVPLRGFQETTAEDMYSYYMSDQTSGFEAPLLKAKGRASQAESPFGHIGAMASSGIAADMKNRTKLALYYMVANRPKNDLVTVSDVWYENTGIDDDGRRIFTPVYPEFSDELASAAAKKAYEEWEAGMQEKAKAGMAFKGRGKLDLHNTVINIDSRQERSHVIKFKLAGEDKMMFINGNPRAAQAINGELNVETSEDYQKVFGKVLRWFSGINTSYNPEFWLSNMQRDTLMALMSVGIKEDSRYNAAFRKNLGKAMQVRKMSKAYKNGSLGDSYIENLYREFAEGGGITGYTTLKKNEEWELELRKYTGEERKAMGAIRDAFDGIQQFGEAIEQMTRFAAFMTSREQGKSIVDSVADAKELTVNFNRKGSGKAISWKEVDKLRGKDGRKLSGIEKALLVGASWIPAYGRRFIMFFNASVQGLNTMYNLVKNNPKRFGTWTAGFLALGMMNAAVHALMDDDDDYLDIPDYERRNNLLVGAGGAYFKWALPQETRIWYGFGDMIVNHAMGRTPNKNIIGELLSSVSDIAPLNPAGGLSAVAPSALSPVVELMMNRDYKGSKIFNDMKYLSDEEKKRTPKYLKAYNGTGKVYINITQALNWLTGGDYADAGLVNLNPAVIEHLVEGMTGGAGTTIEKSIQGIGGVIRGAVKLSVGDGFEGTTAETVMDWLGTDDFMVRNTPFIRRILTINDERYRNAHTTDLFNYYKAEAEHAKTLMKKYQKAGDTEKYYRLMESGDLDIMNIYNSYKGILETYNTMIREAGSNRERRELMQEQDAYRKEMIKAISEIN